MSNSEKTKGKLALYWAASCGGCEIAVLAIDEKILDVAKAFDIVFWPCATDGKIRDVEKMPDQTIDVCLFNGGIRTSEQEYMAQLMRRKSKVLVAFGSCASEGCIPGLANLNSRQEVFDTVYKEGSATTPVNPQDVRPQPETRVPEGTLHLPIFYDTLKTLEQTVDVDYYLPGCPPEAENIWTVIVAVLEGKLPPKGSVIGIKTTVCHECPRKRNEKKIKKFYRTWQVIPDEETCLLEQGLLCCGIAICGSGVGASVVANKVAGVRACLIHETFSAHQGVEDDDLNMICLGGLVVGHALAWELVKTFLGARFSGAERHRLRLAKVAELESRETS
jgi:F420-non-reducing hydrogenase small subunit